MHLKSFIHTAVTNRRDSFLVRADNDAPENVKQALYSFVCCLTDEQVKKWLNNAILTIRALSESVDKDTPEVQKFISEERLKRDLLIIVARRRGMKTTVDEKPELATV